MIYKVTIMSMTWWWCMIMSLTWWWCIDRSLIYRWYLCSSMNYPTNLGLPGPGRGSQIRISWYWSIPRFRGGAFNKCIFWWSFLAEFFLGFLGFFGSHNMAIGYTPIKWPGKGVILSLKWLKIVQNGEKRPPRPPYFGFLGIKIDGFER
jgi:hypothetical protein